ncbi:MAG: ATP-dependent helicase [Lachnospiraceae bacterium]|nr:ATP-dependent helicase [Lachnospiraceae bacterium]
MEFNEAQKTAISHLAGPMMVIAGPGSGKTAVITERLLMLTGEKGIDPSHILVVTFTRAAADEMRQRFYKEAGRKLPVSFGTFHSVFFNILKYAYNYTSGNIVSAEEKFSMIRGIIEDSGAEYDSIGDFSAEILAEIGKVKSSMIDVRNYYSSSCADEKFKYIYNAYNKALADNRKLDFEDMISDTYELLSQRHDILAAWQKKFTYIEVDEFQDISPLQYRILKMLAEPENNLFIVGDDDQSIYAFRGASPEMMRIFGKDFSDAARVTLGANYRCSARISRLSAKLISLNTHRFDKKLTSCAKEGPPVDIREFASPKEENAKIVSEIRELHAEGLSYSEIAVIYRTNTLSRLLVENLMNYNIPFLIKDELPNIFNHWIARDLIAYMDIAAGSRARSDYLRIINRPNRYVSRQAFSGRETSVAELIMRCGGKSWIQERLSKLEYDLTMIKGMDPYAAISYISHAVGYEDYLISYAAEKRLDADELLGVVEELKESAKPYKNLAGWKKHIEDYGRELLEKRESLKKSGDEAVTVCTMHHAKGLEFDTVFIADANERITPHRKALLDDDIEEERRMFYVAMTRSRSGLHIYYLKERYGREMERSRFIDEIMR